MIVVPLPIFQRLIRFADHSFEQVEGLPQANTLKGRMILQCHADSKNVWSVWSVDRDRRIGRFARLRDWCSPVGLPEWKYPLQDEKTPYRNVEQSSTEPCWVDAGEKLCTLNASCRMAIVACYGHFTWLPDWLKLASYCRSPGMARLFYARKDAPEEMFEFGYPPYARLRQRATKRVPLPADHPQPVHDFFQPRETVLKNFLLA